jgi:uncharacterized membrane protein YfcA
LQYIRKYGILAAGICAGAVNGLFGAGGGMVLIPLLSALSDLREEEQFPASITIILPICLVSLSVTAVISGLEWRTALPYLPGSAIGGLLAGFWGRKIPTSWLHRGLGILILFGGFRYLC